MLTHSHTQIMRPILNLCYRPSLSFFATAKNAHFSTLFLARIWSFSLHHKPKIPNLHQLQNKQTNERKIPWSCTRDRFEMFIFVDKVLWSCVIVAFRSPILLDVRFFIWGRRPAHNSDFDVLIRLFR